MTPSTNARRLTLGLVLLIVMTIIWLAYSITRSLHITHTTGVLSVQSSDKKAILSISGQGTTASIIGSGSSRIRLKPGLYLLYGVDIGKNTAKVVHVSLRQTTEINLDLNTPPIVPSVSTIAFKGTDSFLNNGLTDTQINNLKQLLFNYKQTAQTVVVDANSVATAPHSPNDPNFILNFNLTIDGEKYKGTLTYADLNDVQLTLYDASSGIQLFSASSAQSSPDS